MRPEKNKFFQISFSSELIWSTRLLLWFVGVFAIFPAILVISKVSHFAEMCDKSLIFAENFFWGGKNWPKKNIFFKIFFSRITIYLQISHWHHKRMWAIFLSHLLKSFSKIELFSPNATFESTSRTLSAMRKIWPATQFLIFGTVVSHHVRKRFFKKSHRFQGGRGDTVVPPQAKIEKVKSHKIELVYPNFNRSKRLRPVTIVWSYSRFDPRIGAYKAL